MSILHLAVVVSVLKREIMSFLDCPVALIELAEKTLGIVRDPFDELRNMSGDTLADQIQHYTTIHGLPPGIV